MYLLTLNFLLQYVDIRYMINPSQHNFESKIVTIRITWMDNIRHQHHGNIKQLTNLIPQRIIHSMKNCYNLRFSKDIVVS